MTITTYGYKNPDIGDRAKGTTGWMASYNFNVTRFDGHSHNGVDSALLTISSITALTQSISSASWGSSGNTYKQTVTVPAAVVEINNVIVKFINGANGHIMPLHYVRLTATTYDLFCNDNTVNLTAAYR